MLLSKIGKFLSLSLSFSNYLSYIYVMVYTAARAISINEMHVVIRMQILSSSFRGIRSYIPHHLH